MVIVAEVGGLHLCVAPKNQVIVLKLRDIWRSIFDFNLRTTPPMMVCSFQKSSHTSGGIS